MRPTHLVIGLIVLSGTLAPVTMRAQNTDLELLRRVKLELALLSNPGPSTVPAWFDDGLQAALLDPTPGVASEALRLGRNLAVLDHLWSNDPRQHDATIATLLKALRDMSNQTDIRIAAVEALSKFRSQNSNQRFVIVAALVESLQDPATDSTYHIATVRALGRLAADDAAQRDPIVSALLRSRDRVTNKPDVLSEYSRTLDRINLGDSKGSVSDVPALLRIVNDPSATSDIRADAAQALSKIKVGDANERHAIIAALLQTIGTTHNELVRNGIALALGKIRSDDPAQRNAVVAVLLDLFENGGEMFATGRIAATHAFGHVTIDNPEQRHRIIASLLGLLEPRTLDNPDVSAAAANALGEIRSVDQKERDVIVATLLKSLNDDTEDPFGAVRAASARALGRVEADTKEQRDAIIASLLENLEDRFSEDATGAAIRVSSAWALGQVRADDARQRDAIVAGLLKLVRSLHLSERSVATSLLALGSTSIDHVLAILREMNADAPHRTPFWRAWAFAYAGPTHPRDGTWFFLHFMGRPVKSSIPWTEVDKRPAKAVGYLKYIDDRWAAIMGSEGLVGEASARILDIVELACPDAAQLSPDRAWYDTVLDLIRQEALGTWKWIAATTGSERGRHCWTGQDRDVLVSLQNHIEAAGQKTYASLLSRHLKADMAAPLFGLIIAGYVVWVIPSLGLIMIFPYSSRIRAVYLYGDRVRFVLSLGWIPVLLITFPFLRKRLLSCFRGYLIADAQLAEFDQAYWYPGSTVSDKHGNVLQLSQAIPDIVGKILLVGESGLGKSTYLRLLAKTSRRTLAFLNARACHKGVVEAILERTNEVQGAGFFRALIYGRDLAVIIDGLNEVSADIRAIIVAFANEFQHADLLIATQPIESVGTDRSPFVGVTAYELRPLARDHMENFLITRPSRAVSCRPVRGAAYDEAVRRLISAHLDNAPTPEEREAARLILSNPMDLTYAGELLAMGVIPRPSEMIEQAFRLACAHYKARAMRQFPELKFARKVIEVHGEDRNWLYPDEFPNEQPALQEYRLMVPRTVRGRDGEEFVGPIFRHEKVIDFFMQIAFASDEGLQLERMDDPKFRGVYLLFAQTADLETARRLRDAVVTRAANTRDHTLSDEFVRRLALRDPTAYGSLPRDSGG